VLACGPDGAAGRSEAILKYAGVGSLPFRIGADIQDGLLWLTDGLMDAEHVVDGDSRKVF